MIVLDTHAWIWTVAEPHKLSAAARARVDRESVLGVAAISAWEVAMLVAKGRLGFDRDTLQWLRDALSAPKVALLPMTPEIAVLAAGLTLHGDPADRMIAATAIEHGSELVTADAALRAAGVVRCIW